jgi:choline-sulfatase
MNRREFNKLAVTVGASVILDSVTWAADSHQKNKKPNILFIMTDQQHAGMMSCAGNKWLHTPALDSLAQEGIRFENAYCTNPVCVPSRTSMATGVMSCRLGASDNKVGMSIRKLPSEVDTNSLGKILKRAGYDTFYGGKVHMCKSLAPKNAGYDQFYKDQRDELPVACLKFIKEKRNRPFFAVASFINPHDICYAHIATKGENKHNMLQLYREASSLPLKELTPLPENYDLPKNEPSAIADRPIGKAVTPSMLMRKTYDEKAWRIYRWLYHRLTENANLWLASMFPWSLVKMISVLSSNPASFKPSRILPMFLSTFSVKRWYSQR